jgi:hypothetical protein
VPQILAKNVFRQGPRTLIHIGDKDIDYDPEFRLYLATSIANPHFLPEVSVQVCSAPLLFFIVRNTALASFVHVLRTSTLCDR